MVPRNYCKAQLASAKTTHGCNVRDSQEKTQMCVRLGRAPLVNGAFGVGYTDSCAIWDCASYLGYED